jgi:hypothetical protein
MEGYECPGANIFLVVCTQPSRRQSCSSVRRLLVGHAGRKEPFLLQEREAMAGKADRG